MVESRFLFEESEFEDPEFAAAKFVAKYKRVTSLTSLKEDLHRFCGVLKNKLYATINEEYKNFITITTKLDGADQRVDLLRQPLVGLRVDLSALHDGMMASIKALEEKLSEKNVITRRKQRLRAFIDCLDMLEGAEGVVSALSSAPASAASPSTSLSVLSRRGALLAGASGNKAALDLFQCSEMERAAFALQSASALLSGSGNDDTCSSSLQGGAGSESSDESGSASDEAMRGTLTRRVRATRTALLDKVRTTLVTLLEKHASMVSSLIVVNDRGVVTMDDAARTRCANAFPRRRTQHVLRALSVMGHSDVFVECLVEVLVMPHVKSVLTQGRVDGTGGRGSFGGLAATLDVALSTVLPALETPLKLAAGLAPADGHGRRPSNVNMTGADLLLRTLWKPMTAHIHAKFPTMFSTGIAATLHACYGAMEKWSGDVLELVDKWQLLESTANIPPSPSSSSSSSCSSISQWNPDAHLIAFHKLWRLDLYFHLRASEVTKRIEAACAASEPDGTDRSSLLRDVFKTVYSAPSSSSSALRGRAATTIPLGSGGGGGAGLGSSVAGVVLTLPSAHLTELLGKLGFEQSCQIDVPVFKCFAAELVTCFDDSILLPPLVGKFVGLALQILNRLNHFVGQSVDGHAKYDGAFAASTPTGSPVRDAAKDKNGETEEKEKEMEGEKEKEKEKVKTILSTTPMKTPERNSLRSDAPPASASASAARLDKADGSYSSQRSTQEMSIVACDCAALSSWVEGALAPYASEKCLDAKSTPGGTDPVVRALRTKARMLRTTAQSVWRDVCARMATSCKHPALQNVRAIAGKFRMTNKPTPERPSSYVNTLLTPLEEAVSTYGERVLSTGLCEPGWGQIVVDSVAEEFLVQTRQLLDTARQMDSSLQRRSMMSHKKGGGSSGTGLSDSDKITVQISLDVRAFGAEVEKLGLSTSKCPAYQALVAETAPSDQAM